jgi:Protein of unknown function (DUF3179)
MKRAYGVVLAAVTLGSLVWVAIPVVLIRPFGPQTARGLAVSYALRGSSPWLTLGFLVAGCVAAVMLWPRLATWKGRTLACVALAALAGSAFLARQNHFEWMFQPLRRPQFVEAVGAKDVAEDDLVLGVSVGGEARAYPVLALAYHHIVNDSIASEPIVATY